MKSTDANNQRGADMKWLMIAVVVIADAIYDRYVDEADDG